MQVISGALPKLFVVIGESRNTGRKVARGHAYTSASIARECAKEANGAYPETAPHAVVSYVPEVAGT